MDIALPRQRLAVFIDVCFCHHCPKRGSVPASNSGWWAAKLEENRSRDEDTDVLLHALDRSIIRLWEHILFGEMVNVVLGARASLRDEQGKR